MDKNYWKYIWLVHKTSILDVVKYFGGWQKAIEPFIVAVLSAIGTVAFVYLRSKGAEMSDYQLILWGALGGVVLYYSLRLVISYAFTPYRIYVKLRKQTDAFHSDDIYFKIVRFEILGLDGYGIEVKNDKLIQIRISAIARREFLERGVDPVVIDKSIGFHKSGSAKINYESEFRINPGKKVVFPIFGFDKAKKKDVLLFHGEEDLSVKDMAIMAGTYCIDVDFIVNTDESNKMTLEKSVVFYKKKGSIYIKFL